MQPWDRQSTAQFSLMSQDLNREFRLHRMLYTCSLMLLLVNIPWGIYNVIYEQWGQLAIRVVLIATGAVSMQLIRQSRILEATIVLAFLSFAVFVVLSVIYDIPTAQTSRTVHVFFLLIGIASFISFKDGHRVLAYGFPLLCFAAFIFFGSSRWGIETSAVMDTHEREVSVWLNNIIALGLLYILLYVMQHNARKRNVMEEELRKALTNNQMMLYYQPQVDENSRVVGAEALIRWSHPTGGMIPPDEFIPIAEQMGLIQSLGHWVLGTACAQLVKWSEKPETCALTLSVNVSAQEFKQADYVTQVLSVLERSGAKPSQLKLELTESMLVNDVDDIIQKMTELRAVGISISLDDFGTGYSSLSYLKRLPLDQLKVDQSFVREMLSSSQDEAIVRTVVSLAQNMELDVIAEGVETEEQRQFLQKMGCFIIQGYLISPPMKINEFNAFILRTRMATVMGAGAHLYEIVEH